MLMLYIRCRAGIDTSQGLVAQPLSPINSLVQTLNATLLSLVLHAPRSLHTLSPSKNTTPWDSQSALPLECRIRQYVGETHQGHEHILPMALSSGR